MTTSEAPEEFWRNPDRQVLEAQRSANDGDRFKDIGPAGAKVGGFPGIEVPATNPYAVTGWQRKQSIEFDAVVPSGQNCRMRRLEKADLFRLDLMDYLDTFSTQLLPANINEMPQGEREKAITLALSDKNKRNKVFGAIDKVVMACVVAPTITVSPSEADPAKGIVFIEDIDLEDRVYIFGKAFGESMDHLKSGGQADSVGVV